MENIDINNRRINTSAHKVKVPATIFTKSTSKSPINRLRLQTSPSNTQHQEHQIKCRNHTNKKASFLITIEDQQLYFCQKCAITLASQGHPIQRIENSMDISSNIFLSPSSKCLSAGKRQSLTVQSLSNKRSQQMSIFLNELKGMRSALTQTKQAVIQRLIQSQQFYGQQLQQINDYFSLIIKSLQLQKHKCYNYILNQRQQAEQHIRNMNQSLAQIDHDLTKILTDIEDNIQTVHTIEQPMYQLVFNQYQVQKSYLQQNIQGLLLTPISMRKISFQGVPQSIYNLSDIVIKNSQWQENRQYRLADSVNAEEFSHIQAVSPKYKEGCSWLQQFGNGDSLKFSFQAERLRGQALKESFNLQCARR